MTGDVRGPALARFAGHLADPTRATILVALLDGRAWTASELAARARVAPSTATEHLNRLLDAGLVGERRPGRHRYVQIVDPAVAQLLEDISAHLEPPARPAGSLRAATAHKALVRGRTCYDHLAGRLGVMLTDAMTSRGLLSQDQGFNLTTDGVAWLVDTLGVDPVGLRQNRRPVARPCLDWTERRTHLAGVAGAQVCARFFDQGWLERIGSGRAVRPTRTGERAMTELLGIVAADLDGPPAGATG
jgi:DNA-binding transcriptional ArsR family regulator